ncbi:radical SAM protein [Syntrophus aciditrophicus]|uniref:7-carboxy-7-deazaguanine synthase n=1 Tax=Syntrophus aciditrophicus (strain SB) TaxID=56780 RepID=Q2LVK5_SYNAS|nr:radical SAM protein [Syntrophus aciditrophicus]ABC78119.1 queuosine biosynthesis protein [Syntrophus aciditrophicus SB]
MPLKVNEIFYSIQGESSFIGIPCVFVRLTGCNLRCSYCDTRYAYEEGTLWDIPDILDRISSYHCPLVEITGGEPLIQKETPLLIRDLLDRGCHVLLETNGSRPIRTIDERCVRIVDIKCPSSGESRSNDYRNLDDLTGQDEIKFVLGERKDYEFAKEILISRNLANRISHPPIFSPVTNSLDPKKLVRWILEDHLPVRFQLQLHKILWGNDVRGV